MTSRARVYGSAPQFSAKQAELAELVNLLLPGAYQALGQHLADAGLYRDELADFYQHIARLREELLRLDVGVPNPAKVEGPAAQARSLAQTVQQMFLAQALKRNIQGSLSELGRAAFERYGEQGGPPELIQPIRHRRAQVERLEAEIGQLSQTRPPPLFARKRFAAGGLVLAILMIALLFQVPWSVTHDGPRQNEYGRRAATTVGRGDEPAEPRGADAGTATSPASPPGMGGPAGQEDDSESLPWYRRWWWQVLAKQERQAVTATEDERESGRRASPSRPSPPSLPPTADAAASTSPASRAFGSRHAGEPSRVTATFYGGAMPHAGSLMVLAAGGAKWLIDCGADRCEHEGGDRQHAAKSRASVLPCDARSVVAVFVTQSQVEHIGRLPLLVQQGFAGPIYLTEATRELAPVVLAAVCRHDRARIRNWVWSRSSSARPTEAPSPVVLHWREGCAERRKIRERSRHARQAALAELTASLGQVGVSTCAECAADEVAAIMAQCRPVRYAEPRDVAPGITVTFVDAGQIPGAASLLFEIAESNARWRILIASGVGHDRSPLLPGPRPAPQADVLLLATQLGTAPRDPATSAEVAAFRQAVGDVVKRGGTAWITCDVLTQLPRILYELQLAQQAGQLSPEVPIFCPSSAGAEIRRIYRRHQRDGWFRDPIAGANAFLSPAGLDETAPLPTSLPQPCVLLTGSTAWERAEVAACSGTLLTQASTCILCVDDSDAASRGGWPQSGGDRLPADGTDIPVRAAVRSFACFGTCADREDLEQWLAPVQRDAMLVLVRGKSSQRDARVAQLRDAGWHKVVAAEEGRAISLEP